MTTGDFNDYYDEIIHYDARNGYKNSLESYLKHKPVCINKLYKFFNCNWTLLFIACCYEYDNIVRMLIDQFQADVEVENTVVIDDYDSNERITIEKATPLWISVRLRHVNIVKFLVEYGHANVNHLVNGHASPIYTACRVGDLELVQFLIHHKANLRQLGPNNESNLMGAVMSQQMDIVKYLLEKTDCDINHQDSNGRTALLLIVESGSIEYTKLLLKNGALNIPNASNITPLMLTAIHGNPWLIDAFDGYCSHKELIEACELLGTALVGRLYFIEPNIGAAIECFIYAFEKRQSKCIPKSAFVHSLEPFKDRTEYQTFAELSQLISSGSEAILIEALLIRERLLGSFCRNYRQFLVDIAANFADRREYNMFFRLIIHELNTRMQYRIPLELIPNTCANVFDIILLENEANMFANELSKILSIMKNYLGLKRNTTDFNGHFVVLLQLITVAAHLLSMDNVEVDRKLSIEDGKMLLEHVQSIVKEKFVTVEAGDTLLHLCCNSTTQGLENVIEYPCIKTVRLLVHCGIDVDAQNIAKNTVLHILIRDSVEYLSENIIYYLINNTNVHLDLANSEGYSPLAYARSLSFVKPSIIRQLQDKIGILSLKCRCARLAKYRRLPYERCLSSTLANFVVKH